MECCAWKERITSWRSKTESGYELLFLTPRPVHGPRERISEARGLGPLPTPDKFYKGRSQEKTPLQRLAVFLFRSPLDCAGSVLTTRTRCSVTGQCGPAVGVFSTTGFHRLFATKPVSSETSKAERWSNLATIVLLGTHWPIAFSGYPRGPRVF